MKKLVFMMVLFLMCAISAMSQEFTEKKSSFVFDVESGIEVENEYLSVGDVDFKVFKTKNGAKYVKAVSKAGKTYPVWIGERTGKTYKNLDVYRFKSGNYAYFKRNSNGYPIAVRLEVQSNKT